MELAYIILSISSFIFPYLIYYVYQISQSNCRFPRKFELTKRHLVIVVCIIWIIAIGGSASSMTSAGVIGMIRPVSGKMHLTRLCIQVNPTNQREQFQLAFRCSMYVIYALFLFLLYTKIGLFIYKTKSPGLKITAGASATRKKQAVRMLATATFVMIFSYLPYMVLVSKLLFSKPEYYSPVFAVEILCNIISALNHVVNPFIYCALSQQFREGFSQLFAYLRSKGQRIAPETKVKKQQKLKATGRDLLERNGKVVERLATSSSQISLHVVLTATSEASMSELTNPSS